MRAEVRWFPRVSGPNPGSALSAGGCLSVGSAMERGSAPIGRGALRLPDPPELNEGPPGVGKID